MRARNAAIYSVLRLLFFLVPFGIMLLLPPLREQYWIAAVCAALIGLSLSVIFLRRPLDAMTADLAERRTSRLVRATRARTDEEEEDALS